MAFDDRDPSDLKRHVLLLLLHHPQGVRFGDFSGAFHQLHGCHPRISLYGYSSLRQLIADMEDMVVIEGSSETSVMKFIKGLTLNNWMEEQNGLQSSAEEPRCLMNGEKAEKQAALSDTLAAVTKHLVKYKWGLKIKKLQELLLAEDGVDLEKFSISIGRKDTLEFLEVQMPELHIHYKGTRLSCVVQLCPESLSDILVAVSNLLAKYKLGLKIKKLQELLLAGDGIDLKKTSISCGYKDTLEFLEAQMPELRIQCKENHLNCVVQLPTEGLSDTLMAVKHILAKYKLGLKIKKLQELLLAGDGVDLEKFSISHGYKDTLEFLEVQMPELNIQYKENHLSCVVQLPAGISASSACSNIQNCGEKPAGQPPVPCLPVPSLESDSSACSSNPAQSGQVRPKSGTSSPAPCPGTVLPTCNSDAVAQKLMEMKSDLAASSVPNNIQNCEELPRRQAPELSIAFFLIRDILQDQPHGLKLKKLKKALNENYKFNLETFRSDLGYKDVMSCLQDISGLLFQNVTKPKNCVVQLESRACSPAPSLDSDFSACSSDATPSGLTRPEFGTSNFAPGPDFCAFNTDTMPQKHVATSSGAASSAPCPVLGVSAYNTDAGPQKAKAKKSGLADVLVALTSLLAAYQPGLRITKLQEFLLARDGIDLEKFSISQGYKDTLEFLEAQMTELSIHYREDRLSSVVKLAAACSCSSSTSSASLSVDTERTASHANNQTGTMPRKIPDILALVNNLLAMYVSGLKVKKVQEFLLARERFDLEKFSITHGYKDTLEFLEHRMPQLTIKYGQNRLSCVVKNGSGCGDNGKPLSTSRNSSASKAQDQSLPLSASSTSVVWLPVLPSWSTSHGKIGSSPPHLPPGSAQPPKACQLNGPLPPDVGSSQVAIEVPRTSSLLKDQTAKDLEDMKRQVAHILATHPEGMSLFQFRAAYSATYQQHLPLGNASSAKQWLLEMPDVVQLKGCGVQTLLLPVSSAAPSAKSGLPVSSTMEEMPKVPGHTLPLATTVAEPPVAQKALSKALEVPQHCFVSFLPPDHGQEPGSQEACILPGVLPPIAQKTTDPWKEHQRSRDNAEDISGQPDSSRVEEAAVDHAISLPQASLAGAPKSCLKPPAPKTAALPTPQPRLSSLQASELQEQKNSKKCSQPRLQKAPLPVYPVRTHPKPECISFPPQSPVVFPTTPTSWDKNLKTNGLDPKSMHLTNPWSLSNSGPALFASQPVSDSFQAWPQPVVYPPIAFLSEIPDRPVTYPVSFFPTPVNPSQTQFPKTSVQSHPDVQKLAPMKPAQVIPPIHRTEQWTYVPTVPHSNIISQVPEPSRTLPPSAVDSPAGWPHLSPPRNMVTSHLPKSQAVHQLACSNPDGLQGCSLLGSDKKLPDTTLGEVTSEPLSPVYPRHYNGVDSLVTSSSTLPISSHSLPSNKASLEPPYASSSIQKNSNPHLEPPAFMSQQQFTSGSTVTATSDMGSMGLPPSALDPTTSAHDWLLHPSSSIISNSDVQFSEPQSFIDPQACPSMSVVRTVSSMHPLSSPPYPVGSTSNPPIQPSSATWRDGVNYGAPDQRNATPSVFNQTGSPSGPLSRRQTLTNSSSPDSPPPQSFDKCVIL